MGVGQKKNSRNSPIGRITKGITFSGLTYITSYYKIDTEKSSFFPPGGTVGACLVGS